MQLNDNETKTEKNSNIRLYISGGILIVVVITIWYGYGNWVAKNYPKLGEAGQYGDMFGAINALFTGLAFAGLIITILLQSQELKLQRQELTATRAEFSQQNETLKRQRFETTFFNLMNLREQQLSDLNMTIGGVPYLSTVSGRDIFQSIAGELKRELKDMQYKDDEFSEFQHKHLKIYNYYSHPLRVYLQGLHAIMRIVDETELLKVTDKRFYIYLVVSFLSNSERLFLFYHFPLSDKSLLLNFELNHLNLKYSISKNFAIDLINTTHEPLNGIDESKLNSTNYVSEF